MVNGLRNLAPTRALPTQFTALPTRTMVSEFNYNKDTKELKIHVWLYPEVSLRWVWQLLAEAFGAESLKWTEEASISVPHRGILTGSIFIGLKSEPKQVFNALTFLSDLDERVLQGPAPTTIA